MEDLKQYVVDCRNRGFSDEQIRQELATSGWDEVSIREAMGGMPVALAPVTAYTNSPVIAVSHNVVQTDNGIAESNGNNLQVDSEVLPGVDQLFRESWVTVKRKWKTYLAVLIVGILISIGIQILMTMAAAFSKSVFVMVIIVAILLSIVRMFVSTWMMAGMLLAFATEDNFSQIRQRLTVGRLFGLGIRKELVKGVM